MAIVPLDPFEQTLLRYNLFDIVYMRIWKIFGFDSTRSILQSRGNLGFRNFYFILPSDFLLDHKRWKPKGKM